MAVTVTCLSPFPEEVIRSLFKERHQVDVRLVPEPPAPLQVRQAVEDAELVIGDNRHRHRLDGSTLQVMSRCRLIQMPAVGFDTVDHRAAAELGIPVANAGGYNREAVADWTVMAILNLIRHGARGDGEMRKGGWPRALMIGQELGALTVGIVGMGNVGSAVARRLVSGFGARVIYTDVLPREFAGAEAAGFDDLIAAADVVCLHTPWDPQAGRLITADVLARMKPGSILVNAARGGLVDQQTLIHALRSGHLAGAALDVFEVEPLPDTSELRALDNVFLTPHVGGATRQAQARVLEVLSTNLLRVLNGEEPMNVVNGVSLVSR